MRESTKSLRTLFARVKKEESPTFLQEGFDKNVLLYYKKKLNAVFKIYDYDEEDSEEVSDPYSQKINSRDKLKIFKIFKKLKK